MRRAGWALAVLILGGALCAGCTSGRSTVTPTTTTAVSTPASTVLSPHPTVTVPFTADNGALVVTDGPPPDDVTQDQAVAITNELLRSQVSSPKVTSVVHGLVTLAPGLAADSVTARAAWIVVYDQDQLAACPASPQPTAPASASNLRALLVFASPPPVGNDQRIVPSPIYEYQGAGLGLCGPTSQPVVLDLNHLRPGAP